MLQNNRCYRSALGPVHSLSPGSLSHWGIVELHDGILFLFHSALKKGFNRQVACIGGLDGGREREKADGLPRREALVL